MVEASATPSARMLVATDCLSEGINLQEHFDAVVHYDLCGTRRATSSEKAASTGSARRAPVVRATLIYGANNPVDGAVLEVILRKAEKIREELGVPVPIPDDGHTLSQALMKAVLLRGGTRRQASEAFRLSTEMEEAKAHRGALARRCREGQEETAPSSLSGASSQRTCCPSGTSRSPRLAEKRMSSASQAALSRASGGLWSP